MIEVQSAKWILIVRFVARVISIAINFFQHVRQIGHVRLQWKEIYLQTCLFSMNKRIKLVSPLES